VNILDENVDAVARQQLRTLNVRFRHIGTDIGHSGMKDRNDVIPLLHSLKNPTFFTRDEDYYSRDLIHSRYCLVYLDVPPGESARHIFRFLRDRRFRKNSDRVGRVLRLRQKKLSYYELKVDLERHLSW
jgi:hypothetical protein